MTNARQHERQIKELRAQIDDIARSFRWNPEDEWVQAIKAGLELFEPIGQLHDDIHQLRYRTYSRFDYRSYLGPNGSTVTARYTESTDPNPLDIFARSRFDLRRIVSDIDRVVIGSHDTELLYASGELMGRFVGYGRKMHYTSAQRARNAQLLVMELLGDDLEIEQIAVRDMNHFYERLILTRDECGPWQLSVGEKVRA